MIEIVNVVNLASGVPLPMYDVEYWLFNDIHVRRKKRKENEKDEGK